MPSGRAATDFVRTQEVTLLLKENKNNKLWRLSGSSAEHQLIALTSFRICWQKEASDIIPSKSELIDVFIFYALLPGQIVCINTHPPKRLC